MKRIRVSWDGPSVVGLALTTFYFADSAVAIRDTVDSAVTFWAPALPSNVELTVEGSGDVIDAATGDLTDVWSEGGNLVHSGSAPTAFAAAGVGACINWLTAGIVNARRVRGRTFVVPLEVNMYDAEGTLTVGAQTALNAGGAALAGGGLVVWHRPTTPGGSDGSEHAVTGFRLRDRVAFLSSRRD